MAVISGFFNASESSGKRDRVYSADDFGAIFDGIISDGIFKKYPDSVYDGTTDTWSPFKVKPTDASVPGHLELFVNPGRAWFDRTWTLNDDILTIQLESRDAQLNRIDGIYIKIDKDERQNSIYVSTGEEAINPTLNVPAVVPGHVTYYLLATVYVTGSVNTESAITEAEITNKINAGGAPYVESNVTDPDITVDTILKNLENEFDSYQSRYGDEFTAWMDSIKDSMGNLSADEIIKVTEMIAEVYNTDYVSGGYPYVSDDCMYLSSAKDAIPPLLINFGFVTGSMYPNSNANEITVYTSEIQGG